jgi:hypothetical protein
VVYSKYAGTEVAISGDEHVLLKVEMTGIGPLVGDGDCSSMVPRVWVQEGVGSSQIGRWQPARAAHTAARACDANVVAD